MNRHCLLITSSPAYILGLNSILNAFEYYGSDNTDVVIMHPSSMVPYVEYVKDKFSYSIISESVEAWGDKTMCWPIGSNVFNENMNCVWAEYNYMDSIKDKYDAICMCDADMLILGDIRPYMKIAAGTDLILLPHFVRCGVHVEDYKTSADPEKLARGFPVFPCIMFFNPKHHIDIMNYVWKNRWNNEDRPLEEQIPQEEMYLINMALIELNKVDKVLELPGYLWMGDIHLSEHNVFLDSNAKFHISLPRPYSERIMAMHSRWWNKNVIMGGINHLNEDPVNQDRMKRFASVFEQAIDLFNNRCTVTLKDIRNVGGYDGAVDAFEKLSY